jgi:hypothetical protein
MNKLACYEIYQRERARIDAELLSIAETAINAGRPFTAEEIRRVAKLMDERNLLDRVAVKFGIAEFDEGIEATLARTAEGRLFTPSYLRTFDEYIDGILEGIKAAVGFDFTQSAAPIAHRAQQLSSTKEKMRSEGSFKKFDEHLFKALKHFEDKGIAYADETRRAFVDLQARGFPLSNNAHNANGRTYALAFLWIVTQGRSDAKYPVWLRRGRNDRLRRGDRKSLDAFAAGLTSGAEARTLSTLVRREIRWLRAIMDYKNS